MATQNPQKINRDEEHVAEVRKHNIGVMMPFVKFSIGALGLVARTLFGIIKMLPTLKPEKSPQTKGAKIIRLK